MLELASVAIIYLSRPGGTFTKLVGETFVRVFKLLLCSSDAKPILNIAIYIFFSQHFYFQRAANWLQCDIIFIFDPNRPLYSTGTVLPPIMPNVSNLMDEKVITYMLMILFPYPHSSHRLFI